MPTTIEEKKTVELPLTHLQKAVDDLKVTDFLTKQEIKELTQTSDYHGWRAVATSWGIIAGSFALVAWYPNVLTVLLAMALIGGRHLALAILMHEASHYSLFKTRELNNIVGKWLCAAPVWQDLDRYRIHHMQHHNYTGTEKDPDMSLVDPFPITKKSFWRKIWRDMNGMSFLKRTYGLILMDTGFLTFTAAADPKPIDQTGRTWWDVVEMGWKNMFPVFATNMVLFTILYAFGQPWLYLLWVGGNATFFSVFVRLRSMAEHACTVKTANQFLNTRTTRANIIARLSVAPHYVNYHVEHHLLMTVPHQNLPKMHKLLVERGVFNISPEAHGYAEIVELSTRKAMEAA